ncbi:DUF4435 domain-containing protein [Sporosarcina aquimarina]|uniref:DUF4435 domain-containing protein n=1 Tax=Sporosarcina aquimarina TaxID=114975 RepID=UPI001C8E3C46|nr:DUF4435 domain-containing protein [Sporosarcina aquimarina]MBY0221772.1 DUF4435 domain-containing protein [Sporosarcina aquimarina]
MAISKLSMKESLEDKSVAWMQFSRLDFRNLQAIHCFFEGEDRKYYINRIEDISMKPLEEIIGYDCKGKRNVIRLWKKIKNNVKYQSVLSCFFVDKDYGLNPEDYDTSVYETPCYSIENLYVTRDTIKQILVKEFGINAINSDYNKTLQDYDNRLNEFRNILAGLNTFIICFQKLSASLDLEKFKLGDFIHIDIREIKVLKEMSFENINVYYHTKLSNECKQGKKYSEENLQSYLDVIGSVESIFKMEFEVVNKNLEKLSHGKLELYFLKKILENLKLLNDKKNYFSLKRDNISLDTNSKNLLSNLSKYAYTPKCLVEFLTVYQSTESESLITSK